MTDPYKLETFRGMRNSKAKSPSEFPDTILNMDSLEGRLITRMGQTKIASLPGAESIFKVGPSTFLCKADKAGGKALYLVDSGGATTEIADVVGTGPLYYADIGDYVLISSDHWKGKYTKSTRTVASWGVEPPSTGPIISSKSNGILPPGTYFLCFTRVNSNGEISGNGPIERVELTSIGGFDISNMDADFLVWCTEPDGDKFYYANDQPYVPGPLGSMVLESESAIPPTGFRYILAAHGRVWGAKGSTLYYSDPYSYSWFRDYESFDFLKGINGLAWDEGGIYVFAEDITHYLKGGNISEMQLFTVGDGLIEGTVSYLNLGESGKPLPVWASPTGFFQGQFGTVTKISDEDFKILMAKSGAGFAFYDKNKIPRIGATAPLPPGFGLSDNVEATVIRQGRIVTHTYNEFVRDAFGLTSTLQGA